MTAVIVGAFSTVCATDWPVTAAHYHPRGTHARHTFTVLLANFESMMDVSVIQSVYSAPPDFCIRNQLLRRG